VVKNLVLRSLEQQEREALDRVRQNLVEGSIFGGQSVRRLIELFEQSPRLYRASLLRQLHRALNAVAAYDQAALATSAASTVLRDAKNKSRRVGSKTRRNAKK